MDKHVNIENKDNKEENRIPVYNKSFFYHFSYRDLFIDLIIIVFSIFLSVGLFEPGGIIDQLKTWQILGLYCVVVLTMPYFFGYLYVIFKQFYSKGWLRVILWVFILVTLSVLIYMVRLVIRMDHVEKIQHNVTGFFAIFAAFLLVLGPMMSIGGGAAAEKEISTGPNQDVNKVNYENVTGVLMVVVLSVVFMIYIIGLFPEGTGSWLVIVAYLGGPILAMICYGLYLWLMSFLSKKGIYKYLIIFASRTFPLFLVAVLVFWTGIGIHFMLSDLSTIHGKYSFPAILSTAIFTGIIPLRIILMLYPPLRLSNLTLGFASIIFLLWNFYLLSV